MTSLGPHPGHPDPWGPSSGVPGPAHPPVNGYPGQPYGQPVPPPGVVPPYGQPYGYGHPYALQRRTNGLAIASMVLGILWLYWIGSILALVFGYIARKQVRERGEAGGGTAIAGIVLGWVGVGLLGLLLVVGIASRARYGF